MRVYNRLGDDQVRSSGGWAIVLGVLSNDNVDLPHTKFIKSIEQQVDFALCPVILEFETDCDVRGLRLLSAREQSPGTGILIPTSQQLESFPAIFCFCIHESVPYDIDVGVIIYVWYSIILVHQNSGLHGNCLSSRLRTSVTQRVNALR